MKNEINTKHNDNENSPLCSMANNSFGGFDG